MARPVNPRSWIGVDLDGTLAVHEFDGRNPTYIGPPVQKMVDRVLDMLAEGWTVKILTARVCSAQPMGLRIAQQMAVKKYCMDLFGVDLEVTAEKDFNMVELWDDRAIQIIRDTGIRADGKV